jgi:hypothetical protein
LRWCFPSKLISKCCNFSMDWDRVKGSSAFITRYHKVVLGLFVASLGSKIVLEMRKSTDTLQTPKQNGAHPPLATLWCIYLIGDGAEKLIFYYHF